MRPNKNFISQLLNILGALRGIGALHQYKNAKVHGSTKVAFRTSREIFPSIYTYALRAEARIDQDALSRRKWHPTVRGLSKAICAVILNLARLLRLVTAPISGGLRERIYGRQEMLDFRAGGIAGKALAFRSSMSLLD